MGLNSLLARFAVQSDHLSKSGVINHRLFKPTKDRKLSVFRIEDKTHEEIVKEGKGVVRAHKTAKTLYGWVKISTQEVNSIEVNGIGLKVLDDDIPPGHSTIVGWPEDEDKWSEYLHRLAELATPTRLESPIPVP